MREHWLFYLTSIVSLFCVEKNQTTENYGNKQLMVDMSLTELQREILCQFGKVRTWLLLICC